MSRQTTFRLNKAVTISGAAVLLAAGLILAAATMAAEPGEAPRRLTVAILWFEEKTGDPNASHWRYAIEGALSNQLRKIKATQWRSRGVEFARRQLGIDKGAALEAEQARKMGEMIEAQRVIWGHYQRENDKWLVSAYVLNVASGQASAEFKAASNDWFEVRDKVTEQILKELHITPSEQERQETSRRLSNSPAAFEWYSKAHALAQEGKPISEQEEYGRKAIAADPNFARAYMGLAAGLGSQGKLAEAEQAIDKALKLRPDSADGHLTFGTLLLFQRKAAEAERQLLEAHRLDPDFSEPLSRLAQLYGAQGKWDEAIAFADKARLLDPMNAPVHGYLGFAYANKRNRDKALAELKDTERLLDPESLEGANAEQMICQAYRLLGEIPKAVEHYENFIRMARKHGVNPQMVGQFEQIAQHLRASLTPSVIEASVPKVYTEQTLQETLQAKLTKDELEMVINPLAGSAQIKRWAQELTQNAETDLDKARALFDGLTRRIQSEEAHGSRTAQEVFTAWSKPDESFTCQEFAKLFVALGRDVKLAAFCVVVERDYSEKVVSHMCAAVFSNDKVLLLDPTYRWFGVPHKKFVILDDLQTVARHLSQFEGSDSEKAARCRVAAKLDPNCPVAYVNLAGALIRENQWQQARQVLKELEKRRPDYWGVYLCRGGFASHEGDLEAAAGYFRKALELRPEDPDSHYHLGLVLAEQGMLEEAREEYRASLRCQPAPALAGNARRRIAQINESIGVEQTLPGEFVSGDELERAILDYTKALEINPRNAGAYVNRAGAYLNKGEYDLAISDCSRALDINARLAQAHGNRGLAYLEKGKPDRAISDFNRVLEIDPRDAKAYVSRALAYINKDKYDEAISDCSEALKIDPRSAEAYSNRARAYTNKGKPDKAISDCDKALEINPMLADAYGNRGFAYKAKGLYDQAIADFSRFQELRRQKTP